jgi:hypothetical protein
MNNGNAANPAKTRTTMATMAKMSFFRGELRIEIYAFEPPTSVATEQTLDIGKL